MSRRFVLALLLVTACKSFTGPSDPFETDKFDSRTLASYTKYSDGGADPWTASGGVLSGAGFSMQSVLIRTGKSIENGWVETAVTAADDGGLVVRFLNNENYLLLAIRDDSSKGGSPFSGSFGSFRERNLEIYRKNGPAQDGFTSLWSHNLDWQRGQQKIIRFEVSGDSLNVFVDGNPVGGLHLTTSSTAGLHLTTSSTGGGFGLRHQGTQPDWISRYEWLRWSK